MTEVEKRMPKPELLCLPGILYSPDQLASDIISTPDGSRKTFLTTIKDPDQPGYLTMRLFVPPEVGVVQFGDICVFDREFPEVHIAEPIESETKKDAQSAHENTRFFLLNYKY